MKRAVIAFTIGLALCSCTIAPKSTAPAQASDWAKHNIVSYDSKGINVRVDWVRAYHGLIVKYGDRLPVSEQVPPDSMVGIGKRSSSLYHVDWIANKRFTDLKQLENELSGP